MRTLLLFVLAALLVACSASKVDDAQLSHRIDILYTHTGQMIQYTSVSDAETLNMDFSKYMLASTPDEKLAVIEATLKVTAKGDKEKRIEALETRMNDVMVQWAQTPSGQGFY